jgi:hypothetical protein
VQRLLHDLDGIVWVLERAGVKRWVKRAMRRNLGAKAAES